MLSLLIRHISISHTFLTTNEAFVPKRLFRYSVRANGLIEETNVDISGIQKTIWFILPVGVSSILLLYCITLTAFSIGAATTDLSSSTVNTILIVVIVLWALLMIVKAYIAHQFRGSVERFVALLWKAVKMMTVYLFATAYISGSSMALSIALIGIYGDPVRMRLTLLVVMLCEVFFFLFILAVTKCVVTLYLAHIVCLFGCLFFGTVVGVTLSFAHERNPNVVRIVLGAMLFCEVCITIILYYLFKRKPTPLVIALTHTPLSRARIESQPTTQGEYTMLADAPCI